MAEIIELEPGAICNPPAPVVYWDWKTLQWTRLDHPLRKAVVPLEIVYWDLLERRVTELPEGFKVVFRYHHSLSEPFDSNLRWVGAYHEGLYDIEGLHPLDEPEPVKSYWQWISEVPCYPGY